MDAPVVHHLGDVEAGVESTRTGAGVAAVGFVGVVGAVAGVVAGVVAGGVRVGRGVGAAAADTGGYREDWGWLVVLGRVCPWLHLVLGVRGRER